MNGRNRQLTRIGGLALAATLGLLSCTSSDPTSPDVIGGGGGVAGSAPSIAFVLPEETCTNAGNTITIYGTNFTSNPFPTVTVNGTLATVLSLSTATVGGTPIQVLTVQTGMDDSTIPPNGLLVTVTVTTANGTTSLPSALRMLPGCTRPPSIVAVEPSTAVRTGGTPITIRGIDLACATSVRFSGTQTPGLVLSAEIIEVVDDTTLVIESPVNPSLTSETFDVTVTSGCGTGVLAGGFIFTGGDGPNVVPNATAITPPEGPAGGGNQVRITGSDLNLVDSILVGPTTIPSSDFLVQANGEILIPMMPASPVGPSITVPVNVTVRSGDITDNSPVVYTYLGQGAPECGVISPTSGTQLGGTNVLITAALGSSLASIDGVLFGGVPAPTVLHPNPSLLAVTTPPYPTAVDVEVVLTVGGVQVGTCPLEFTYLLSDPSQSFSVDSIFPDRGPQRGGTQIQIAGNGLTGVTSIEICDVPATITQTEQELVTAVTGRFDGTTPATCDVVVTAGALGATLPAAFTYTPVVPDGRFFIDGASTAPEAGGLNFRIQGTDLIGVTEVSFSGSQSASGQALACNVQVQSNTEVTGIVPRYVTPGGPFPADVDVFVQSAGGIDSSTAVSQATGRRFRYYANPRLLSASGPGGNDLVGAGDLVTVTGVNFRPENDTFVGSLQISNSGVLDGRSPGEEELGLPFFVQDTNTLTFTFPAARVEDFYDITIQTPLPGASCTDDYSFTLVRGIFFGTPPSAASVVPRSGPFSGGTEVVISGDFGTEVTSVTFDGISQSILEQTPTTVTVVTGAVPENQAGTPVDVVVTGLGGNSTPLIGAYTFIPAPDVFSATTVTVNCPGLTAPPNVLPVTQGQVVTVNGTDLIGVNQALIGDAEASVIGATDTQVQVAIPPAPTGGPIFNLTLLAVFQPSPGGAQDDPLTATLLTAVRYQDPPSVTGVTPETADPGSFVQIAGTNLRNADGTPTQVFFGGVPVAAGRVSSNADGTLLTVEVPAGPEGMAVQVEVTTCQGSAFSPVVFEYPCTRPQVDSLLPASGSGGTVVDISGLSLLSADGSPTTVTFGTQTALVNLALSTPTNLVVTAPPGDAGDRVEVELETCGGTVLAGFFTYGCGTPQITGITPTQGRAGTTVIIQGSNLDSPDGTPVQVIFGPLATGTPAAVDTAASSATQLVVTAPPGVGTVAITVINCGGMQTFAVTPFTYCPTPSAALAPGDNQGSVGSVVTITGLGLLNPDTSRPIVRFGGVEAAVLESPVPTGVSLDVQVPAGSGSVIVEVETCGGIARAGSFQYCLQPALDSFMPPAAPAGALVTLVGANLIGSDGLAADITFAGIPATVVDDSPFVVMVPAGPTGTVQVTATTCGGTSQAVFTYCVLPVITDVNVGGGAPQGPAGTAVSIVGTNLVGADGTNPTVLFGTAEATIIDASPTALLVSAPGGIPNGTTVSVRVTTCGGTGTSMAADNFTYMELAACPTPPSAATITIPVPASGPAGTQVTIEGSALVGEDGQPATVLFGAFTAQLVTSAENVPTAGTDTLVVAAPDGGFADLTNVPVTLVTCGGSFNVPGGYTYLADGNCPGMTGPVITTVAPNAGGAGTQVTITGTNLVGPDGTVGTVRFEAFTANLVTFAEDVPAGSDTLVVTAPNGGFADGFVARVTVETCVALSASMNFTYQGTDNCPGPATPTIATLAPNTGGPGTQVTITGANLVGPDGNAGVVRFGAFTAQQVAVAEDVPAVGTDTIVVSAPNGGFADGTIVPVTVETCFGLSASMNFTYAGADDCPGPATPTIATLAPNTGGPGTQVTITGANLVGPDGNAGVVRFGAFTAQQVAVAEDVPAVGTDTIVVNAPDGGFGDGTIVPVTVETCIGLSASMNFTYVAAVCDPADVPMPFIIAPVPEEGPVGTQVTLEGANLFGADGNPGVVRFGAFVAQQVAAAEDVPFAGTDTIVVTVPDGGFADMEVVPVTVTSCSGSSGPIPFTHLDAAVVCMTPSGAITSPAPAEGAAGTVVVITGMNLVGADGNDPVVQFGTRVASILDQSATSLTVQAPGNIPTGTTVVVRVTTCGGTGIIGPFDYTDQVATCTLLPSGAMITDPAPAEGGSGTLVTITGTNLVGEDGNPGAVTFGVFPATLISFTDLAMDTLLVTVPAGPPDGAIVEVTVTTCGGSTSAGTFEYTGGVAACVAPMIAVGGVSPSSGQQGTIVTITGMNLLGADGNDPVVQFGTRVASLLDATATQLIVEAPGNIPTGAEVSVRVTTCGGSSNITETFTYTESGSAFSVSSIAPTEGARTGGTAVTITGTGLADVAAFGSVEICGIPAAVTGSTATTVTATTGAYTALAPQLCNVVVSDGTDTDILVDGFTYTPVVPDATMYSGADTAPAAGGGAFQLDGTLMLDTNEVSFGGLVNDPTACELQVQSDTTVTGTIPAYRTPSGPFPAMVNIFAASDAGSDETPLIGEITYFANPVLGGATGALSGPGLAAPGEMITLSGGGFHPTVNDHVGAVMLEEVSDMGTGIEGFVAFDVVNDTTITFTLPFGAASGDVFDVTIFTPDRDSDCTSGYSFTLFSGITVP